MKNIFKRFIVIMMVSCLIFTSVSNTKIDCYASGTIATGIGNILKNIAFDIAIGEVTDAAHGAWEWLKTPKKWFDSDKKGTTGGGHSRGDYGYSQTTDNKTSYNNCNNSSADNDYVYNSYSSSDNSSHTTNNSYSIVKDSYNSTTHSTSHSVYSPVTNTYETINNTYYNNEYNTYNFQTNNYNYYVTNNNTYVTYYIENNVTNETNYYEIYYEMPDGRNTYDLEREDVWGEYFVYDVQGYEMVAEDDGTTIGLWHLDGDGSDSSYHQQNSFSLGNGVFSTGKFGQGLTLTDNEFSVDVEFPEEWTLEFYVIVPSNSIYPMNSYDSSTTYIAGYQGRPSYTLHQTYYREGKGFGRFGKDFRQSTETSGIYHYVFDSDGSMFINGTYYDFDLRDVYNPYDTLPQNNVDIGLYPDHITFDSVCLSDSTTTDSSDGKDKYVDKEYTYYGNGCVIDEIRLSSGIVYLDYVVPPQQPFDTNQVLVPPDTDVENAIAVKAPRDITDYRIGGVRPVYVSEGFVWISLDDHTVNDIQQYVGNGWESVGGSIYQDGRWIQLKGLDMEDLSFDEHEDNPSGNGGSGGSSGSGDSSGSGGSSGSGDGGSDSGILGGLFDGIVDIVSSIVKFFADIIGVLLNGVSSLLTSVFTLFKDIIAFPSGFSEFLTSVFAFVPSSYWSVVTLGLTLSIIASIIKIFRG